MTNGSTSVDCRCPPGMPGTVMMLRVKGAKGAFCLPRKLMTHGFFMPLNVNDLCGKAIPHSLFPFLIFGDIWFGYLTNYPTIHNNYLPGANAVCNFLQKSYYSLIITRRQRMS